MTNRELFLNIMHYRDAVETELRRLVPLMKDGGYMIMPDHLITPGVALTDYQWHLDRLRALRY